MRVLLSIAYLLLAAGLPLRAEVEPSPVLSEIAGVEWRCEVPADAREDDRKAISGVTLYWSKEGELNGYLSFVDSLCAPALIVGNFRTEISGSTITIFMTVSENYEKVPSLELVGSDGEKVTLFKDVETGPWKEIVYCRFRYNNGEQTMTVLEGEAFWAAKLIGSRFEKLAR